MELTSVSSLPIVELSLQLSTKLTIYIITVVGDYENDENAKGVSGKMLPGPFRVQFTAQSSVQLARLGCLTYTWDAEPGLVFTSHHQPPQASCTRAASNKSCSLYIVAKTTTIIWHLLPNFSLCCPEQVSQYILSRV